MAIAVLEHSPSLSRDRARADVMLRGFIAAAVVARLVFWTTTNRMFEDGLTTITHARNVPLGLGLVHHAGEGNVHGFTSAIGVLIPLVGELVHQGSGMFAMRVASCTWLTTPSTAHDSVHSPCKIGPPRPAASRCPSSSSPTASC